MRHQAVGRHQIDIKLADKGPPVNNAFTLEHELKVTKLLRDMRRKAAADRRNGALISEEQLMQVGRGASDSVVMRDLLHDCDEASDGP